MEYKSDKFNADLRYRNFINSYESETVNTLKQQAINQLERNNMRPNTVTINQGSLINIYTAQDIDFSGVVY